MVSIDKQASDNDVDSILTKLMNAKSYLQYFINTRAKPNKQIQLTENELKYLCLKSKDIFISQPVYLELESPINVCGN